ncbi:hypothetical protein QFZ39_005550 [Paraburkholderia graminis]|jgi:hypothetical protein|nr:hypothetical protein [Paraburkholderia graminis]
MTRSRSSSRIASIAPTGRGLEPYVRVTVTGTTRRPVASQSAALRSTLTSMLSIVSSVERRAYAPRCATICNSTRKP